MLSIYEDYKLSKSDALQKKFLRLFLDKNSETDKNGRSEKLIADFSKGYADGWKFIVRPCNYDALDIMKTGRVIKGKTEKIYTQGVAYNFVSGSVFYDTIDAYNLVWSEALKIMKCALQIDYTTPTIRLRNSAEYGLVEFSVWRPNADETKLEKVAEYSCRQNEFVNLLKTGEFADLNGEIIRY